MFHEVRSRARQIVNVMRAEGLDGAVRRARVLAHRALGEQTEELPLHAEDVADSTDLAPLLDSPLVDDRPLRIGWITTPPGAGSGGHTTMFRVIEGLQSAGHQNRIYLYDMSHSDLARHERVIRENWTTIEASVRSVSDDMEADVWIATSWQTAHVLASRPQLAGKRMYFVQDYEPYFYARGALYALAEDTYRFGFTGITAGAWLADELSDRFAMECHSFDFGADTNVYRALPDAERDGVVFYTKPGVARRGHEMGILALERFARARPEIPIHLFGDQVQQLPFEARSHGRLTPRELDNLYNSCRIGVSLSFTNVSLIPWELLASGVVPIVNDALHNRLVLKSDGVAWSPSSPAALARTMEDAYDSYDLASSPQLLARTVAEASWSNSADSVVAFIESKVVRHC